MRIVLDTNVIVSALLTPTGLPAKILNLILERIIKVVYDNDILAEYVNVLSRKELKINMELAEYVIDFIKKDGEFVITKLSKIKFSDESDRKFYDVYKTAGTLFLITGNARHFPKEAGIVSPKEFLDEYWNQD